MPRPLLALPLACALASCADDRPEPLAFGELCGVDGPLRIVELGPDQAAWTWSLAGRLYYLPFQYDADGQWSSPDRALWSTGPCGESPRHIADDITYVLTIDRWPGLLLACISGTGVVSLDPEGVSPPHLAVPTAEPGCRVHWTAHGILDFVADDPADTDRATPGAVVLRSIPADPRRDAAETEVLVPAVPRRGVRYGEDTVHYLTPDATLMRLDLADRGVTALQANVYSYSVTDDRRYLLWQDAVPTSGPSEYPTGVVSLRDLGTDDSVSLGGPQDRLESYSLDWIDRGYLPYRGRQYSLTTSTDRIYRVPDLDFIDIPPGARIASDGLLADDRCLLERYDGVHALTGPWLSVLDLRDETVTPLFSAAGQILERDADSVVVLAVPPCCVDATFTDEGELWRVPLDGSPATLLAERASMYATDRLDPTRLLVGLDTAPDRRMNLHLVDTDSHTEHAIAAGVTSWSTEPAGPTTILTYSASDDHGSGIWRVRLPPAP